MAVAGGVLMTGSSHASKKRLRVSLAAAIEQNCTNLTCSHEPPHGNEDRCRYRSRNQPSYTRHMKNRTVAVGRPSLAPAVSCRHISGNRVVADRDCSVDCVRKEEQLTTLRRRHNFTQPHTPSISNSPHV